VSLESIGSATVSGPVVRLGIAQVERRVGLERSTISRRCRAGAFPRPLYLGTRRFWTEQQIAGWEAEQLARQPEAECRARELMERAQAARQANANESLR
jgi:predicted DNA-binding transcriptional regulator AlpA